MTKFEVTTFDTLLRMFEYELKSGEYDTVFTAPSDKALLERQMAILHACGNIHYLIQDACFKAE